MSRAPSRTFKGAALALLMLAGGPAQAEYIQFATADSYLAAADEVRDGYVAGLADTLIAFDLAPEWFQSCTSRLRLREMRSAFDRWLRNHPAESRFSLPSNFVTAIDSYCSRPVPW